MSVAKALLFRQKAAESKSDGDLQGIELAVNILEKQLKGLDDMETWTSTIQSNGAKFAKEIEKIRETANVQIEQLRVLPERTQTGGVRHEESSPTTLSGNAILRKANNIPGAMRIVLPRACFINRSGLKLGTSA